MVILRSTLAALVVVAFAGIAQAGAACGSCEMTCKDKEIKWNVYKAECKTVCLPACRGAAAAHAACGGCKGGAGRHGGCLGGCNSGCSTGCDPGKGGLLDSLCRPRVKKELFVRTEKCTCSVPACKAVDAKGTCGCDAGGYKVPASPAPDLYVPEPPPITMGQQRTNVVPASHSLPESVLHAFFK